MSIFGALNKALTNNLSSIGIKECSSHYIFEKAIDSNSLILDIGANQGSFHTTMQHKFDCKCITVEASPELFERLPSANNLTHYNYAICGEDGPIEFIISNNPEANSLHTEIADAWGISKKVLVDGLTFESFKKKHQIPHTIDLLKIDIEGAELDLLENISFDTIKRIGQIPVEFHDFIYSDHGYIKRMKYVIKKLEKAGFIAIKISNSDWRETLFINTHVISLGVNQKIKLKLFHPLLQSLKKNHSKLSARFKR